MAAEASFQDSQKPVWARQVEHRWVSVRAKSRLVSQLSRLMEPRKERTIRALVESVAR